MKFYITQWNNRDWGWPTEQNTYTQNRAAKIVSTAMKLTRGIAWVELVTRLDDLRNAYKT